MSDDNSNESKRAKEKIEKDIQKQVALVLKGKIQERVSRKTARAYLQSRGIEPMEKIAEVFGSAMEGFQKYRGDNEFSHYGPSYLAIAGKMAELMARYTYPTFTAVKAQFEDITDEVSGVSRSSVNAKQVRDMILADPMSIVDKAVEDVEKEMPTMDEMLTQSVAAIASGDVETLEQIVLPKGKEE